MNRDLIRRTASFISKPLSLRSLRKITAENFIFPFYHLISGQTPDYIRHFYSAVSPERFREDLDFLLKHYQPATILDLSEYVNSGKKSKKPFFFLSFDDGLRECYEIVYPLLKEKGIQAAFFVNPGFVDNKNLFYRFKIGLILEKIRISEKNIIDEVGSLFNPPAKDIDLLVEKIAGLQFSELEKINQLAALLEIDFKEVLETKKPYMSLSQIKELSQNGFLVGSHSLNHPDFSHLEMNTQIDQLDKSMQYIKNNFEPEILTFAFPFSDVGVSSSFFEYIENSSEVDITFGTSGLKKDQSPTHIHRIPMEKGNFRNAEQIIRGEYGYYILKSMPGKNKIKR